MNAAPSRRRTPPWPEFAALAALALLVVGSWLLVSGLATGVYRQFARHGDPSLLALRVPGPDPAGAAAPTPDGAVSQLGHYGYFWSERAFHYRTTLMFAVDGAPDPALLRHDTDQQHPDGVDAWREYTLLMEPVYGLLYRLAGDQSRPLVEFLLRFVPLLHALLLVPLYFAARALGAARPAAVGAAAAAAACAAGFMRLSGSLLLKEDFSLLLLLIFTALHLWAWRRQSRVLLAGAARVLAALLSSWHLAQFLAALVLGSAAVAHAAAEDDAQALPRWAMPAAYAAAFVAAGLTPSLQERWFLLSPPAAVAAAWLLVSLLAARMPERARRPAGRVIALLAVTALLGAAALLNPVHGGDYGHVTGLLEAKLRHGFLRPDDPGALPFAVRMFWAPPFHSPGLRELGTGLGWTAPALVLAMLWSLVAALRPGASPLQRSVGLLVPALALLWLFAARLGVVFVPFAALAAAPALQDLAGRLGKGSGRAGWIAAAALASGAAANLGTTLAQPLALASDVRAGRPVAVATSDDVQGPMRAELLRWLTRATPGPGSAQGGAAGAVLADIGLSPQILLYAQRPVVLNSQFENVEIRRRAERFLAALYADDPQVLLAFAHEHDARWLVIDRTMALADEPGSTAWAAGVQGPLATRQTVVRLHLDPQGVPGFAPVWDNEYYRVFAVLPDRSAAGSQAWQTRQSIWWQEGNLSIRDGHLVNLAGDRARLAALEQAAVRLQDEQRAILEAVARRRPGAPDLLSLQRQLALAAVAACTGDPAVDPAASARQANAVQALLADVDPATGLAAGAALRSLLDGPGGWRGLLAGAVPEPGHRAVAAQLAATVGRFDAAAAGFRQAAADADRSADAPAPAMQRQLWDETLLWLAAAGRCDEARRLAESWLPRAGRDGPGALVRRLASAP